MFEVRTIETPSLGDRSYLVSDGSVCAVVDPQRDIDRVLAAARDVGARITHVLETHLHNDYVSGGLELSRTVGAAYLVAAADRVDFDRTPVHDGDVVQVGDMRLRAMHTPGHTHHHVSYALQSPGGDTEAVFTGGSMLFGATGRTDLLGPEHTDALTRAQYRSVRRLAAELPGAARVLPTHGFGSFCAATPTTGAASTIAEQRGVNPALTRAEQDFVDELVAGLGAYPAYYAHMMPINSAGPAAVDLSLPELVDPATLRARIAAGEWVVDLRHRTAFAAGHLAGSLSFEFGDSFVTYIGWLHPWGAPLTLVGVDREQVLAARRELVRIGIDRLDGVGVGDPLRDAPPAHRRAYPIGDFDGLARVLGRPDVHVLDIRRHEERAGGAIPGSLHIPVHELPGRRHEVPTGEVWVHCASGYRAGIAASLLDDGTRRVVHVSDDVARGQALGLFRTGDPAVAATP